MNETRLRILTAHHRPVVFFITAPITQRLSSHPVCVESILPFSDLPNLLVTMLVFLIAIGPRGIINIIPVLHNNVLFFGLPLSLPSTSLSLLPAIKPVHIIIFYSSPVCQCNLGRRPGRTRSGCRLWRAISLVYTVKGSSF